MGKKNKGGGKGKENPTNRAPAPQQTNSAERQNTQTQAKNKGN